VILERALALLVEKLEKTKLAAAKRPRLTRQSQTRSRHIPAAVTRDVWRRDQGRCAFVGTHGRCAERGFLEFHHVIPFADGGVATAGNIQLRCREHNQHEADLWDGADIVKNRPPGYAST
jgi:5-methylcytosine-specific restriction endonuclease McrA